MIGVAPAGFHGTEAIYWPDVWVPMAMEAQIEEHDWLENRATSDCLVAGRLKPHVTRAQAEANLRAIAADLARTYPSSDAGIEVRLSNLGLAGDTLRNPIEAFVFGVILLAAMVLLAACANLASLMTARGADRAFRNRHSRVHRRQPGTNCASIDDGIGIFGACGRRRRVRLWRR